MPSRISFYDIIREFTLGYTIKHVMHLKLKKTDEPKRRKLGFYSG